MKEDLTRDLALFDAELNASLRKADRARKWSLMTTLAFVCLAAVMMLFSGFVPSPNDSEFYVAGLVLLLMAGMFNTIVTGWDSRIRYLHLRREVEKVRNNSQLAFDLLVETFKRQEAVTDDKLRKAVTTKEEGK